MGRRSDEKDAVGSDKTSACSASDLILYFIEDSYAEKDVRLDAIIRAFGNPAAARSDQLSESSLLSLVLHASRLYCSSVTHPSR